LLNVSAAAVTLIGLYFAGFAATGRRMTGLFAASLWVLLCGDITLQANQPNTEVFMNAALVWGIFWLLRGLAAETPQRNRYLLAAGCAFGIATWYKQVSAVLPIAIALYCGWFFGLEKWKRAATAAALLNLPGIVLWLLTAGYFFSRGRLQDFTDVLFIIGRTYAADREMAATEQFWHAPLPPATYYLVPLWAIWLAGSLLARRDRYLGLGIAWLAATAMAICLPGKFFPHYFQLYLPVACWTGAVGVTHWAEHFRKTSNRALAYAPAVALWIWLVYFRAPDRLLTPTDISKHKYGDRFIRAKFLSEQLKTRIAPGTGFFVYGMDAEFYYHLKCVPASGVMNVFPLYRGPLIEKFNRRVVSDLEKSRPQYVLVDLTALPSPFLKWLDGHYVRVGEEAKFVLVEIKGPR
jgi:hypothetical protein